MLMPIERALGPTRVDRPASIPAPAPPRRVGHGQPTAAALPLPILPVSVLGVKRQRKNPQSEKSTPAMTRRSATATNAPRGNNQKEKAMSVNTIILVGNLGRDPQTFGNGDKVTRLSIATDRVWKDEAGTRQQATDWHPVVAFGSLAELAGSFQKGDAVAIEGRCQSRTFEKDDQTHHTYEVVAQRITPPSRLGRSAPATDASATAQAEEPAG